jgi:non-canonical poly(A) RNA polymerase PAPD5/7
MDESDGDEHLANISYAGGWDPSTETIDFPENLTDEIAQAFKNVDLALKTAGGKGWSQVYRVTSYHTELDMDLTAIMTENFRKYMPDHKPIWTQIGVRQLGAPKMNVEIEVVAHDPQK